MRSAVVDLASQSVTNLSPNPKLDVNSSNWSSQTPTGKTSAGRVQNGPFGTATEWSYEIVIGATAGQLRLGWRTTGAYVAVEGGATYTIAAWVYSSRAFTGASFETQYADVNQASLGFSASSTFDLVPGWQFVRQVVTVPAAARFTALQQLLGGSSSPFFAQPGDVFRVTRTMFVKGDIKGPPADGDSPGWRWTGTAGNSTSAGYPYTLESIAGAPLYFAENVAPSSSATLFPNLPTTGFTVCTTARFPGSASVPGLWEVRAAAGSRARRIVAVATGLREDIGQTDGTVSGRTVTGTPTTTFTAVSRVQPLGMDVILDGGSTTAGAAGTLPASLPSGAYLMPGARDNSIQPDAPTIYGLAIYGSLLDDTTAKRVGAWLARKYGSPIPTGF